MISIFCRVTKFGLLLTALVLVAALRLAFMVRWTLEDTLAFLLLLSLLLPSLLIMFIPSTFKRPVSSWKALNVRKTLLMASSVRLKPLNCSRLPCVYAQETLTFLLTQKKTCVKITGRRSDVMSKGKKRSGARPGRPQPLRGTKGKRKGARLWYVGGDRKSGSAGMPRPISYAVFCLKKKKSNSCLIRVYRLKIKCSKMLRNERELF